MAQYGPVNKRLAAILLSAVVSSTACNRGHSPRAPTSEVTSNEYAVLSASITDTNTNQKGKEQPVKIVISNMTQSGDDDLLLDKNGQRIPWEKTAEYLRGKVPALQRTTIDAFREANAQQAILHRSFVFPTDYKLVDSTQLHSIFKKNGDPWPAFYKQFPGSGGLFTFSRVGFSADGTQALFYLRHTCGLLCGGGAYVVMEKRDGRWVIWKEITMWVS